ncbi:TPA: hypothetical protein N3C02_002506 [Vibrio parahaemolyticus]|uniref:hypothetical protein n=1 Tax=Vibrio parahaemolyticus TaxID=670 RepID=UPI001A2DA6AD|nr:hypothetical protein [Vibrio parahaemolyticus]HAS6725324.1 hypothetical protein [Vibrio parahaemolyticus]HAS6783579.1 hypothetical protein [Vibrio parahaemolyticus]HAS6791011.1 hypothetical protein [Vibrio parahaemolyticus]HAS6895031.1 hypothetical protein [Vibrio parahaemolyticus]HAS6898006.1 hypothetical protein [Vibrio parahaemolyticus]
MRTIRLFHRRMNYSSTTESRVKCEHSLAHSLRITPPTNAKISKKLEFNEELSQHNFIWIKNHISPLESWTETERLELLYKIVPEPRVHNQLKLQTQQRQYRRKMKNAIDSEIKSGNTDAAKFLQSILEADGHVSYSSIQKFSLLTMQRKKQRLKMLETYLNAHNQLQHRAPTNNIFIQEGIFKIPHRWEVGSDLVNASDYIEFTRLFLVHYFPDYEIKTIICHDDERDKNQNTGCHTHYFLSALNQKTNKFDLHKRQIQVVSEYIEKVTGVKDFFPSNSKLTRKETQDLGHYFQRMVQDFANEHLCRSKGLLVEFSTETERRSKQRKEMDQQAKLPKSQRKNNLNNYLLKRQAIQRKELASDIEAGRSELDDIKTQVAISTGENEMINELKRQNSRDISAEKKEIVQLRAEKHALEKLVQNLKDDIIRPLSQFCQSVFLGLKAKESGQSRMVESFLDNAMKDMLNLPPSMQVKAKLLLESVELRKSNLERNKTDQKSESDTFER